MTISTRRLRAISATLAAALPVVFLAMGAFRAFPFVDDVLVPSKTPDDWHTYKEFALSVVRSGLSIPALSTSYAGLPHGFLYIYFVALIFAVTGVNSTYVYLVQSFALGVSIALMYVVVRERLTPLGGLWFLLTLTTLMYIDVFRHLTFKLLSENLYFLLYPLLLWVLFRAIERTDHARRDPFLAGVMFGLVVLARPSFVLSAVLVMAVVGIDALANGRAWTLGMLLLGGAVGVSGVIIRNFAATGQVTFDIVTNTADWLKMWNLPPLQFLAALVKRSLFAFGLTELIAPAYRARPHWMIMWCLWVAYPVVKLLKRQPLEVWEVLLYLYVTAYIVPVILVADITSYGGRMVITILPVVLIATFRLLFAPRNQLAQQAPS